MIGVLILFTFSQIVQCYVHYGCLSCEFSLSQLVFLVYPFSASVKIAIRLKLLLFNEEIESVLAVDTITYL
jgi:hypothetical protein